VRLAFLGSGAAFSQERYNGAVVVDGRILLDGGAPLLPHMHRLGIDPGAVQLCFLTHFHGDHMLGLPPFVLHHALGSETPLTVVGPAGVEEVLEKLFVLAWGREWETEFRPRFALRYLEAEAAGEVDGVEYESVTLDHGTMGCTGYRLHLGARVLAYAGDTEMTPPLERLVTGADLVITEATGPGRPHSHTSWEEAQALAARHPGTRFFFNHVYAGELSGAVSDLEIVDV
jgi:ribonuclease BN (tRNA processing enzyme)